jgi:lysophospholipase L1-like esterase
MKKLLFFGDSITDATRNREETLNSSSYGYGFVIQIAGRIIPENPTLYSIINEGISGNRITDLYARIKNSVWNKEPDVLTILIGVNDIWHEINYQNGVDIERYKKLYDILLEDTKKRLPNVKIVLMEPFVLRGSATIENFDRFLEVKDYAKVVKELAKKHEVHFIPLQDKFDKKAEEFGPEYYLWDGVHPSVAGATLIAEAWIKYAKENKII